MAYGEGVDCYGIDTAEYVKTAGGQDVAYAGKITLTGLVEYADNAAALVGGLTAGDIYHTAGSVKVVT